VGGEIHFPKDPAMSMPSPAPLKLTPEIKSLVDKALEGGNPLILAVVDTDNHPHLSYRGSTQAYSDTQLAFWLRNTGGGTIAAIERNSHVALMYRSAKTPMLQFKGRARIATDENERKKVFEASPEREQGMDAERKGIAVIIDLDRVEGVLGFGENGPIWCLMVREGA
jgi:hypothetical protein